MGAAIDPDIRRKLDADKTTMSEIRDIAKKLGNDQALAERLWRENLVNAKLLAILVMEKKQLTVAVLEALVTDMETLPRPEQEKLCDWLLANQVMYVKKLHPVLETWMDAPSILKQRMFWSYQARIMRMEKAANAKAGALLGVLEKRLGKADPFIQGVMNWCAAQIGIYDVDLRKRCIALGEKLGLYKDYPVSRGCTSPYLPEWISFEVGRMS